MSHPEHLYQLALALLVVPFVPLNRMAWPLLLVWVFGQLVHYVTPHETVALMFARIAAFGAGRGLLMWEDDSRRFLMGTLANLLFIPSALLAFYAAAFLPGEARTMAEYDQQVIVYWLTFGCVMVQAALIPFSNNWTPLWRWLAETDAAIMARLASYMDSQP